MHVPTHKFFPQALSEFINAIEIGEKKRNKYFSINGSNKYIATKNSNRHTKSIPKHVLLSLVSHNVDF